MAAIDDLNAAVAQLQTDVGALIVAFNTPNPTESQVVAATANITAVDAAVKAALAPTPPPTPGG